MLITTKNSTYLVIPKGCYFSVTKVDETKANTSGIEIGWHITCVYLSVTVGKPAYFDSITTSNVQEVTK